MSHILHLFAAYVHHLQHISEDDLQPLQRRGGVVQLAEQLEYFENMADVVGLVFGAQTGEQQPEGDATLDLLLGGR